MMMSNPTTVFIRFLVVKVPQFHLLCRQSLVLDARYEYNASIGKLKERKKKTIDVPLSNRLKDKNCLACVFSIFYASKYLFVVVSVELYVQSLYTVAHASILGNVHMPYTDCKVSKRVFEMSFVDLEEKK